MDLATQATDIHILSCRACFAELGLEETPCRLWFYVDSYLYDGVQGLLGGIGAAPRPSAEDDQMGALVCFLHGLLVLADAVVTMTRATGTVLRTQK